MKCMFTFTYARFALYGMLTLYAHLIKALLTYPTYVTFYVPSPVVNGIDLLDFYFHHSIR
ncbi:hypothetical protein EROM_071330 [Encephalitozoon romaleae SJ-2008]|uniref:Uncharacterized protein n=1 Tax=Encephalitozoon romaleae (strain SJ-2008) TaxID=1178016 RepID=I7ANM8_ENCRO|nr:hypothetical protein EROM_071330 [Encephalitozoon romaleae SJ-2008]AFN83384.1 hypothetical protein EROM_071330 [Encephalitozoon romaleae SJ-2008]